MPLQIKMFGRSKDEVENWDTELRYLEPITNFLNNMSDEVLADKKTILVLDTETTGYDDKEEIIEFSGLKVEVDVDKNWRIVADFHLYNEPTVEISEEITEITGLCIDDVRGHHITEENVKEIMSCVELCVAHKSDFDRRFVEKLPGWPKEMHWGCTITDTDLFEKYGIRTNSLASVMAQCYGYYMSHHKAVEDSIGCLIILLDNLEDVIRASNEVSCDIFIDIPYDEKHKAKERGYRWDSDRKYWLKNVNADTWPDEEKFIEENSISYKTRVIDNLRRFIDM